MSRYEVRFKSSGVVAFSASERGICTHWVDQNNYAPETPYTDPDTGETDPDQWVRGECLNLFEVVRCKPTK